MTDEVEDVKTWLLEWGHCIYHSASLEGKSNALAERLADLIYAIKIRGCMHMGI